MMKNPSGGSNLPVIHSQDIGKVGSRTFTFAYADQQRMEYTLGLTVSQEEHTSSTQLEFNLFRWIRRSERGRAASLTGTLSYVKRFRCKMFARPPPILFPFF